MASQEEINRIENQLANARLKSEQAEQDYSSTRESLSKIGKEYFKESLLTLNGTKEYTKQLKELTKTLKKIDESNKAFNKALDDATKAKKKQVEKTQQEVSELEKQLEEAKKPGFWQKALGLANQDNSFEQMYRVRQRYGGLEQIAAGNVGSGISQFLGSFKTISNIMGGPLYLGIQAVVTGLLTFDKALAKASERASSITGGIQSQYIGQGLRSFQFNAQTKQQLYELGMQDKYDELRQSLLKGYGYGFYSGKQDEFLGTMAYAQKGLGSLGISAESSNNLLERLRLIEGKDRTGTYAQIQRFINNAIGDRTGKGAMRYFSPEQALNQMMTLADQTKGLGTNFEWASSVVKKFEKGLKDGTQSLSDFAAVNRSLRGGNISSNAGIASLISLF